MPEFERDFGTMYFRARGEGRKAIVLLHDYFGTHRGWTAQQLQLSRYALVLAPDLRGHGRSVLQQGELTIAGMASDMVALLDYMEIDEGHLVGCSHGAVVAMHLARTMPERVASIVLSSVPDLNDIEIIQYGRQYISSVFPRINSELEGVHGGGNESYARDVLLKHFEDSLDDPPRDHLDAFRLAHEISCPTLILGGDSDPVMSPERAIQLMRKIPAANVGILPNAGHLAHEDAPTLYADTVLDHILRSRS